MHARYPKPLLLFVSWLSVQIVELEAQCKEADQEKQKNAQLTVRVQELEAELRDKEQVRRPDPRLSSGDEAGVQRRSAV